MANKRTTMLLVLICINYGCSSCDKKCSCNSKRESAICSELTYIPRFPEYIKSINFTNNIFNIINKEFMSNLTKNNISSLFFISNSIQSLYEDAFTGLPVLKRLMIRKEKSLNITDVRKALSKLKTALAKIILMENGWTYVPNGMFGAKAFRNIAQIRLSKNSLLEFSFAEVSNLLNLDKIDLSENKLITLDVKQSVDVKNIIVDGNDIVRLPSFCSNTQGTSRLKTLKSLYMSNNALSELKPSIFKCLPSLTILHLNNNRLTALLNNTFSVIPQLDELQIKNNKIKRIHPDAFNSISLQKL